MRAQLLVKSLLVACISLGPGILPAQTDPPASQCAMCHGVDGNSPSASAPSIAGITPYYFKYTMDAYKNGGRNSDIMKMFAGQLSAADIEQLALFYSGQKPLARQQAMDSNKAAQGQGLHQRYCEKCHSNNGGVSIDGYGVLAGQWTDYLRLTLQEYLAGKRRTNAMMLTKLRKMQRLEGEGALERLIQFYAGAQPD
ncbi:MAG: c-type cytochrome [Gammaproteobacteria bacterium]|nr:c-type cytochrome [Gammaproteobacteria bacterium]MDH5799926.1 c-type cytochrome [Gammaproteobacteria bacterium]